MKKFAICAAFGIFFGAMFFTACDEPTTTVEHSSSTYTTQGTYSDGTVITDDGNIWDYSTDMDNDTSVVVVFDNMGTNSIYDDEILTIVER